MTESVSEIIRVKEKYHLWRRGREVCRYGIYGLSREYFSAVEKMPPPPENQIITLQPPAPRIKVMQAVITSKCNLRCSYCSFFANTPATPTETMSPAELEALAHKFNSEIGEKGLLLITGGEPELCRPAVDYLAQNVIGTKILFTNGTLLTDDRLKQLAATGINILFSLDGDLLAQDAVRIKSGGSFKRVAKSLSAAKKLQIGFGISAVVGDHNIDRLPELVEYMYQEFAPQSLGLNLPHNHAGQTWNRMEEYTQALLEIFQFAKKVGLFVDQLNRRLSPLIYRQFRYRDCAAQGEKIVAYPGGAITSCVNEGALMQRNLDWGRRMPLHSDQCQDCFAIGICGGGCIFDGESSYGPGRFDERNCYFTKKLLEHFTWDFKDALGDRATDEAALVKKYHALLHRSEGVNFSVGHETSA